MPTVIGCVEERQRQRVQVIAKVLPGWEMAALRSWSNGSVFSYLTALESFFEKERNENANCK